MFFLFSFTFCIFFTSFSIVSRLGYRQTLEWRNTGNMLFEITFYSISSQQLYLFDIWKDTLKLNHKPSIQGEHFKKLHPSNIDKQFIYRKDMRVISCKNIDLHDMSFPVTNNNDKVLHPHCISLFHSKSAKIHKNRETLITPIILQCRINCSEVEAWINFQSYLIQQ